LYRNLKELKMDSLYQIVAQFEVWWLIVSGLFFLAAEWILLDIGIFLTLSITSFAVALTMLIISNPVFITWSFPAWLGISFLFLRPLVKISSNQKDVYATKNYVGQIGRIVAVEVDNLSSKHFFDYKQQMPMEANDDPAINNSYRLLMNDGKQLSISNSSQLPDGGLAVVKTQDYDIVTVEQTDE